MMPVRSNCGSRWVLEESPIKVQGNALPLLQLVLTSDRYTSLVTGSDASKFVVCSVTLDGTAGEAKLGGSAYGAIADPMPGCDEEAGSRLTAGVDLMKKLPTRCPRPDRVGINPTVHST